MKYLLKKYACTIFLWNTTCFIILTFTAMTFFIFPNALWSYISDGITYIVIWLVLSSIQKKGNQIKIPLWINRWFCLKGLEFPCSVVTQKSLNAHTCACDSTMNAINQTNETKKRSKYFMPFVSFSMQAGRRVSAYRKSA